MAAPLHISISAEKIFSVAGFPVTNSMLTSVIVSVLILAFAFAARASLKKTNRPTGLQNLAEFIVESLWDLVHGVTGDAKKTALFFPLIATFFIFILVNNWVGLIPGVGTLGHLEENGNFLPYMRAATADINMTLALALISVGFIQIFGVMYLHLGYFSKFINFSNPLNFVVGILEIVSEFSRIISFAFRLFGNIFAGEVLLVVMTALTKVIGPMPFYGMEIFVGFIQALVFAMLSVVLFNIATLGHGDEH